MFGVNYNVYEDKYKDILAGSFEDNKNRKILLKGIHLFNTNKNQQAIDVFEKLEKICESVDDITVVLLFKALTYKQMKMNNFSAEAYEKLLQNNPSYSRAWSNLGMLYLEMGKTREAGDALRNALAYNPENPYAYCNLATYYVTAGEAEKALEAGLKALKLFPQLMQVMSAVSMAYAMLGDTENSEFYFKRYCANGGLGENLRILLDNINSNNQGNI